MSKRKLSKTTHSGRGIGEHYGQQNWPVCICFTCRKNVTKPRNFSDLCSTCDSKLEQIPMYAQIPKKNASDRTWKLFYDKFVKKKEVKQRNQEMKNKVYQKSSGKNKGKETPTF